MRTFVGSARGAIDGSAVARFISRLTIRRWSEDLKLPEAALRSGSGGFQ